MRLLFVVQRYGAEVAGGAELHCRQFATRLADRGHHVEVVTTCALNYTDWANHYAAGTSDVDGIPVHRLPVARRRDPDLFHAIYARVVWGAPPVPLYLQEEWMRQQGPLVPGLSPWLEEHAPQVDVVSFVTYLYYTTWAGLPTASRLVPTLLHPTAHHEPPLSLPLFDGLFRYPGGFAFLTPEEQELVRQRFRVERPSAVVGNGFDLDVPTTDPAAFRASYGLGNAPYLLFVGRVDPGKSTTELFDFFLAYKRRNPGPTKLVVVGEPVHPLPPHPDVVVTGFVGDQTKHDAMAGAMALVQPSYFESFSMVLAEAWLHRLPAIVQGECDVLVGQSRRGGGGIPYRGFAEFEVAVDLLAARPALRATMGASGRRYVEATYSWDVVLDRYEDLLDRTRHSARLAAGAG